MKTVDEQAVYTCIKNLFSSPTSYSKMILEDADWQEGGISWNDKAQVKELKEEIEIILAKIFKSANRTLDEVMKAKSRTLDEVFKN